MIQIQNQTSRKIERQTDRQTDKREKIKQIRRKQTDRQNKTNNKANYKKIKQTDRVKQILKQAAFIAEWSRALKKVINCGRGGPEYESRLGAFFSELVFQELDGELSYFNTW